VKADYYSSYKAAHHPETIQAIRAHQPVAPRNIQVDLEAYCPHSCEFCSYRNVDWQSHGMVFAEPPRPAADTSIPRQIALEIPRQMFYANIPSIEITGGGESLAYPWITEFLDECASWDRDLAIVTNGVLFKPALREHVKRLQWIRFSMDAVTPEVYTQVHRTPAPVFNTVVKHISDFIRNERKRPTVVGISFVVTPHNYKQVKDAAKYYKDLGADSIRYTFTYEPTGTGRLDLWERQDVLKAIEAAKLANEDRDFKVFGVNRIHEYSAPNDDFSFCGYQHFVWAIGYNGLVYPCCIMKYHPEFVMGDLAKNTLAEIVSSPERMKMGFNLDVTDCKSCWLRDKNKFIESLLQVPMHADFV
jgi:radical SAM protein with 4Fe4S-binding SPASM domain